MEDGKKQIVLKRDWDIPFSVSSFDAHLIGHFVGRKKEVDLLINEIVRKNNGSILVCGYRGVGKTTLVHKAISKVKEMDDKTIFVMFNAAQLEAKLDESSPSGKDINPYKIIENLIRRLYSATKQLSIIPDKIHKKINILYRKAVSRSFKSSQISQATEELTDEKIRIKTKTFYAGLNLWESLLLILYAIISIGVQFIPSNFTPTIIRTAVLIGWPLLWTISIVTKNIQSQQQKSFAKLEAKEIYEFDNSIGNLEFDLEEIHRDLKNEDIKLIYIIDELDKLEDESVAMVLKFFKNLFTLSDALFIFIGHEKLYNLRDAGKPTDGRDKAYTYFSSKYFLSRPFWPDLQNYLNEIIDKDKSQEIDIRELEKFHRIICFGAENDFFDLKTYIKDHITSFDEKSGQPIVNVTNLNTQKAKFHKAVTVLFEQKYASKQYSRWEENEKILKHLFVKAKILFSGNPGMIVETPKTSDVKEKAERDMYLFLYRLGALDIKSKPPNNQGGENVNQYTYKGEIPKDVPEKYTEKTEYEKEFLRNYETYCRYLITIYNTMNKRLGNETISIEQVIEKPDAYRERFAKCGINMAYVKSHKDSYDIYTYSNSQPEEDRSSIEEHTKNLVNAIQALKNDLITIIIRVIKENLYASYGLKNNLLGHYPNLFQDKMKPIRNIFINYNSQVIYVEDFSKQILLASDVSNIKTVKNVIEENCHTNRIISFGEDNNFKSFKGLHYIRTDSPELLEKGLSALYKELDNFFEGKLVENK